MIFIVCCLFAFGECGRSIVFMCVCILFWLVSVGTLCAQTHAIIDAMTFAPIENDTEFFENDEWKQNETNNSREQCQCARQMSNNKSYCLVSSLSFSHSQWLSVFAG